MTTAQEDRMAELSAQLVGESDDSLVIAMDYEDGSVYMIDEVGNSWVAQWEFVS